MNEQLLTELKKNLEEAQKVFNDLEIQMDEDEDNFDVDSYNYWRGYVASLKNDCKEND